jgi:hypothetical protein
VNPATPPTPANLVVTKMLTRTGGNVVVQLTIANTGGAAAANVVLPSVKVGADTATPLPQSIGTIAAGATAQATVSVPGTVGAFRRVRSEAEERQGMTRPVVGALLRLMGETSVLCPPYVGGSPSASRPAMPSRILFSNYALRQVASTSGAVARRAENAHLHCVSGGSILRADAVSGRASRCGGPVDLAGAIPGCQHSSDNTSLEAMYSPGDYIKAEFRDDRSGETEWMWVCVEANDPERRVVFGTLDNEPVASSDLRLGMHLAVSYDNIREHRTPASFRTV